MSKFLYLCKAKWLLCLIILVPILVAGHFVSGLDAQETSTAEPPSVQSAAEGEPRPVGREATITVEWMDKPLREALHYLAEKAQVNIIPDLSITDKDRLTVTFHNLGWREALAEVCRLTKCTLTEKAPNLFQISKPPLVSMEMENARIEKVIAEIAKIAGMSIIISTKVKGTITFSFQKIPWLEALEHIVKTAGFVVVQEEHNVIRIVRAESMAAQLETRLFQLKYLKPPDDYRAKINVGEYAVGSPKAPDPTKEFTLLAILQSMLSPAGKLQFDATSKIIIVKDTKPVLDEIEKVINKLDVEPGQIMFDVRFVNTQNTDLLEFGIDYSSGADDGITITSEPKASPDATEHRTRGPFGTGPTYPSTDDFDMAFLTTFDVTATLRLFKKDIQSKLTQRPYVLTLDGEATTIFVGETIHYAQTTASSNQSGGLEYSIAEASNSPVDVGFQLLVIPHIVRGTNKIRLTILPQDKYLTGSTSTTVDGFEKFTSAGQTIDLPRFRQSTLVTRLIIGSGKTAVIGGLSTDRISKTMKKIPLLGDIPFIYPLFRHTSNSVTKDHLLIFLTPTIIRRAEESQDVLKKRIEKMEGLAPGAEKSQKK